MASSPIAIEGGLRTKSPLDDGEGAGGRVPSALRDNSNLLPPLQCGGGAALSGAPSFRGGGSPRKFAPASLPHQRAPFLSSRKAPRDEMSEIPEVILPEAASTSSTQYGSLRERGRWGGGAFHGGGAQLVPRSQVLYDEAGGIIEGCSRIMINEMPLEPQPPLRSSLTALDILTSLRSSGSGSPPHEGQWSGLSPSGMMSPIDESRLAFGAGGECRRSPTPLGEDVGGHSNPDTFEAFDLDLD